MLVPSPALPLFFLRQDLEVRTVISYSSFPCGSEAEISQRIQLGQVCLLIPNRHESHREHGWPMRACSPVFVVKFSQDTATPICLHITYGCFQVIVAKQSST